ncbi:ATP-binding cassette domain-containing protein [uncultured Oscillibacter sp.]|uniref:ATP-binding cassette domain-containing protein n=1 Tax=uncultured Oscillibacter sp. TaxID=876091 RepID=UPI00262BAF05|nr:ATP-binding cassette domain-containing protein [uncultured Oscillibacter sp.]
MAVIQTMGLSKRYKDRWAVDRLDLRVEQGDVYGFIGRNGAGKSTTLKLLCGLARPTQGEALVFGKPIRDPVARRRVGALIEQPGLYPDLSGRENLRLYAALLGLDRPERQVDQILETVGLSPKEKKQVRHYSMGMKQRLGVGLALLGGPDLLLLDEPINGLDPEGIREMRELLLRLNRERGLTILVSSHILGELSKIATRYGIIQEGRMVEQVTASELEQKCTDYLHLRTDQPQKAAALLERELRVARWEMRPEGEIRIYEAVDTKAAGQVLAQAGIAVEEMGLHRQDLESYFLERMGGSGHV